MRPVVVVAHDGPGHERRGDEDADRAHDQHDLHDHEGRVAVDVADGAADHDRVGGHGPEGEQEEDDAAEPEQGGSQVVAQLEAEDLEPHGRAHAAIDGSSARRVAK